MTRKLPRVLVGVAATAAVFYMAAGFALSRGKELGPQHAELDYPPFDFSMGSIEDYAAYTEAYLKASRGDELDAFTLENLKPFLLEPGPECERLPDGRVSHGVVLTHGLLDTPYSLRPLGEALRERCMLVYGLLLPGHGARPGALLTSSWEDWAAAEHWAAEQIGVQVDHLLLAGHSAGGALSVLESARNEDVEALILFAPALGIASTARYAQFLTPLGRLFPAAGWFSVAEDSAIYRYESFAFQAIAETWALIQNAWSAEHATHRNLPTFAVVSHPDTTVDTDAALAYMAENTNPASLTLLYSQHPETETVIGPRVQVLPSADFANGVLGTSHLGLMTPPDHPYYGRDGEYRNCGHYAETSSEYADCKAGKRNYYGEATQENLVQGLVERIAFNPYYDAMLDELLKFLANLER